MQARPRKVGYKTTKRPNLTLYSHSTKQSGQNKRTICNNRKIKSRLKRARMYRDNMTKEAKTKPALIRELNNSQKRKNLFSKPLPWQILTKTNLSEFVQLLSLYRMVKQMIRISSWTIIHQNLPLTAALHV